MTRPAQWRQHFVVLIASATLGCPPSKVIAPDAEDFDSDIARPPPGGPLLGSLPGPMLGPFDSYSEALFAACRKIFTKPRSSAGRKPPETALREEKDAFTLRWRVSKEYCAWMYYTPDNKYELSLLTDQTTPDPTGMTKRCIVPGFVKDRRYAPDSIQYVVVLHNHTFDTRISEDDVSLIVSQGRLHGFEPISRDGNPRLSVVAFFSNEHENPTCGGFYIYTPYTGKILKWTRNDRQWSCAQTHIVRWLKSDSLEDPAVQEERALCPTMGAP